MDPFWMIRGSTAILLIDESMAATMSRCVKSGDDGGRQTSQCGSGREAGAAGCRRACVVAFGVKEASAGMEAVEWLREATVLGKGIFSREFVSPAQN